MILDKFLNLQGTCIQGYLHLETDMRAMHNPTRMNAIVAATANLVQNIPLCTVYATPCPQEELFAANPS